MAAIDAGKPICEGWVLKRKRKMMQGFARRYFVLYDSGLLEYSFEPGKPSRDRLLVSSAAISTSPGHRDIHIDASNATFHIKCLDTNDFNKWMTALRTFITGDGTMPRRSSTTRNLPLFSHATRALDDMSTTLDQLEEAIQALAEEANRRKVTKHRDQLKDGVKEGAHKLGFFRRSHHAQDTSTESAAEEQAPSPTTSSITSMPQMRLQASLDALRKQHSTLVRALAPTPAAEGAFARGPMHEEPSEYASQHARWHSKRTSIASSAGEMWFDAPEPDGALEFVLEDSTPAESEGDEGRRLGNGSASASISASASQNEDDSDEEQEEAQEQEREQEHVKEASAATAEAVQEQKQIVRRTQLPSGPVGDEGSLFGVLKKNVGKDLSSVAMPVTFNEPLTLLQRAAEELEYFDLLNEAAASEDPIERLCYVAAFAASAYACTKHRSGRKSFNPMLSETFEDSRMNFIAEKVCHQPLVMAYHAEGDKWELNATSSGKTKFWGKSLEIIPSGLNHVRIGEDHFQWRKPSSFMRNLMMGNKYLEHVGEMTIENTASGAKCVLEFKEAGYWGTPNMLAGTVTDGRGRAAAALEGKWDEQIARKLDAAHLKVLWRISAFPPNAREYYGFTRFAVTLNEITPDLAGEGVLCPTDSRWRPDVRALEEGALDKAEAEKVRVEEMQRKRRREGREVKPRWFEQKGPEDWVYKGGYWEERAKGWKDVQPLW